MKSTGLLLLAATGLLLIGCENKSSTGDNAAPSASDATPPAASTAGDEAKQSPYVAALGQAKKQNKFVLLEFTGSDWCPPCKAMQKYVLSTDAFQDYARTNILFVELDFPRMKPQSDEEKKTNADLAEKFNIEAFPTYVLVNSDGKEVWRGEGAFANSPEKFIAAVESGKKDK